MRRYDDPVEVRRGPVEETVAPGADAYSDERAPAQFLWRGRLWKVRAVLAHWVETGPWWSSPGVRAVIGSSESSDDEQALPRPLGDLITERELWRVEAARGRDVEDAGGVFDLAFDWAQGGWLLTRCAD